MLLIMTDNQSPNLLGAYGNRDIRTPNIDQLARDGLLFAQGLRDLRRVLAVACRADDRADSVGQWRAQRTAGPLHGGGLCRD